MWEQYLLVEASFVKLRYFSDGYDHMCEHMCEHLCGIRVLMVRHEFDLLLLVNSSRMVG